MESTTQRRRHERFPFHNSVILRLADGREIAGIANNMGYGGASMIANEEPSGLQVGDQGQLKVIFYGRPTDYPCTIVSVSGIQLGLKIHRTEYQGNPEEILLVKEK